MLGDETMLVSHALLKTAVYALWYSTLFWLPVRGLCAMIDRRRGVPECGKTEAETGYRVGMNVLPPM